MLRRIAADIGIALVLVGVIEIVAGNFHAAGSLIVIGLILVGIFL